MTRCRDHVRLCGKACYLKSNFVMSCHTPVCLCHAMLFRSYHVISSHGMLYLLTACHVPGPLCRPFFHSLTLEWRRRVLLLVSLSARVSHCSCFDCVFARLFATGSTSDRLLRVCPLTRLSGCLFGVGCCTALLQFGLPGKDLACPLEALSLKFFFARVTDPIFFFILKASYTRAASMDEQWLPLYNRNNANFVLFHWRTNCWP